MSSLLLLLRRRRYFRKLLGTGPIAYWPLSEASGTTIGDASGNGRTGTYTAVTLGAPGIGDGRSAASFNGSTSFGNVFSASLASAFSSATGTLAVWGQVSAAGVWSDGINRRLVHVQADASNRIILFKETTNDLRWLYTAAGTAKQVVLATTPTAFFHLALTWDKPGDAVKAYYAGAQTGSTQTALGVWAGAITAAAIGSATGGAANFWSGTLAHVAVWSRALSAAEVASIAAI